MSYKFGGKTRRTQTKIKKGWKDNRKDLKQDLIDVDPDAPPSTETEQAQETESPSPE